MNNPEIVTTTSEKYRSCFGFTEAEVFEALDDYGLSDEKQRVKEWYDGFVLGLLVDLNGRYNVTPNRESGFGRYDVMLEPLKADDDSVIMEFKVYNPRKENRLKETVASALAQIEEKKYAVTLESKGIKPERIRKYGFAFEGKTVLIG